MSPALLLIALLALLPLDAGAAQPSKGMKLERAERSPQEDIVVEHYVSADGRREIWLAPAKQRRSRVLLYRHARGADVLVSPDQRWLVVNDHSGSDRTEPLLFRRGAGVQFTMVKEAEIAQKVWRLAAKEHAVVLRPEFGHRYVAAFRWAGNSGAFLVAAWGHLDGASQVTLEPWICVFSVDDLAATLDLARMNRGALRTR